MKQRVADIMIQTLVDRGVTECFAVVGGGAMHLDNALGLNTKIHKTFNHHEQACAMAAEAYARLTGKLASVCVTSGPGATNAITGVMGAWQDSLPMLVLSGQVRYAISVPASGLPLRFRGIQEFEIIPSVRNMTKYAVMLTDPLAVRRELNKAIDIAMSGRRGPVWLDVPLDIQSAIVDTDNLYEDESLPPLPQVEFSQVQQVLDRLSCAKRPVILAGNGIVNSGNLAAFRSFAKRTRLPVIGACIAADAMYAEYDRYYGLSGSIGPRPGNFILQNADVILALGTSLGFKTTGFAQEGFAPNAHIISVDVDPYEVQKPGVRVDQFLNTTLEQFFAQTAQVQEIPVPAEWVDYCNALKARFSPYEPGLGLPDDERVCAYWFWKKFDEMAPKDAVCILGNNTANSAKLQIGISKEDQRIVANNNCGSMGADLPEAIGAATALHSDVFCLTGDGSIMMNLQELETIRYNKLPVKIVVFSNDGYNAIRQTSLNFFHGTFVGCNQESGISFPSFQSVANTFGLPYHCCHNNGEMEESLTWLFQQTGAALLEIHQRIDDPVTPKVMSRQLPDGTMASPDLQDMYPFLSDEEMDRWMSISK